MKYWNYSEISYEKAELFRYFIIPIFHTTPGSNGKIWEKKNGKTSTLRLETRKTNVRNFLQLVYSSQFGCSVSTP